MTMWTPLFALNKQYEIFLYWAGKLASQTKDIPTQKPRPAGKCTDDEESMSGRQGEAEGETVLRV